MVEVGDGEHNPRPGDRMRLTVPRSARIGVFTALPDTFTAPLSAFGSDPQRDRRPVIRVPFAFLGPDRH
jgi:hypothetical protein